MIRPMKKLVLAAMLGAVACGGTEHDRAVPQPLAGTWFAFIGADAPVSNATIKLTREADDSFTGQITFASDAAHQVPRVILPAKVPADSLAFCVAHFSIDGCSAQLVNARLTGDGWTGTLRYADGTPDVEFLAVR